MTLVGAFSVLYNFADRSSAALFASCISPLTITHRCCCQCCVVAAVAAVSLCYAILLGLSLDGYSYSYIQLGLLQSWPACCILGRGPPLGDSCCCIAQYEGWCHCSGVSIFFVYSRDVTVSSGCRVAADYTNTAPVSCLSGPTLPPKPPLLIMIRLLPTHFQITLNILL